MQRRWIASTRLQTIEPVIDPHHGQVREDGAGRSLTYRRKVTRGHRLNAIGNAEVVSAFCK
ncbi:hypothetical protein B932_2430 [Gluconobacter oxydans H24]|nr:hypothetical protein B932_2430 [Gluconobacter oxydans H24]